MVAVTAAVWVAGAASGGGADTACSTGEDGAATTSGAGDTGAGVVGDEAGAGAGANSASADATGGVSAVGAIASAVAGETSGDGGCIIGAGAEGDTGGAWTCATCGLKEGLKNKKAPAPATATTTIAAIAVRLAPAARLPANLNAPEAASPRVSRLASDDD